MGQLIAPPLRLRFWLLALLLLAGTLAFGVETLASEGENPVRRNYAAVFAPPAPETQTREEAAAKSAGCISCHTASDAWTMHRSEAVVLGCTDCHGGNANVRLTAARPMSLSGTRRMSCPAIRKAGTGRRRPIRSAATPCSIGNLPSS